MNNSTHQVPLTKLEIIAIRRALAYAHGRAKRQARRAQRNAAPTVSGWAMESADYSALYDRLAEYVK